MENINSTFDGWQRGVPDGMFISTYRAYKADLEFLHEQQKNSRPVPKGNRTDGVERRALKTNDAAAYLSISPWKLRNLVQSGEISYISGEGTSPWLFDKQELDHWIETQKQKI